MDLFVHKQRLDSPDLVRVEGAGVRGWCRWIGAVDVGTTTNVELDLPDDVQWDEIKIDGAVTSNSLAIGVMEISGEIADVDESNVVTLVLPHGSMLLVDTVGEVPLHVLSKVVTMLVRDVIASPTRY